MKFSTNARFIQLTPETMEEALSLWQVCDRFGQYGVLKAEPQREGYITVFIDLAAPKDPCLLPPEGKR